MWGDRNDPETFYARDRGNWAEPRKDKAPLPKVTLLDPASEVAGAKSAATWQQSPELSFHAGNAAHGSGQRQAPWIKERL